MTISVVIPAYNAEKYIARTISSVLAQTTKPDEIIIVDDGSTDNTASEIKKFADRVTYIHQQNAGASVARNTGIEHAKSDWIAFLDADDQWMPTHLETQSRLLQQNPHLQWSTANFDLCFCDKKKQRAKLNPETAEKLLAGKQYFDDYFNAFINQATGWTGTMLIKRSTLIEAGLFQPGRPVANDIDMWWTIAYKHPQIGFVTTPQAIYHMAVPDSITQNNKAPAHLAELLEKHLALAEKHNRTKAFTPCAAHLLKYWLEKYLHDERITEIPQLLKKFRSILPSNYVTKLRLLTISPKTTRFLMPALTRINKLFKPKKRSH